MAIATTETATNTAASVAVVVPSAHASLNASQSLLKSTVDQVISGQYTLYISDITTVAGTVFLIVNVWIGLVRWRHEKKTKPPAESG